MSKKTALIILLILTQNIFSQETFKKGYFKNNNGEKINCFILNEDWKNNPKTFIYKHSENSKPTKGLIQNISEFGFDKTKFTRAFVKIDASSNQTNKLSKTKSPDLRDKTLFLKYLVEGKANLFVYQDNNARLFFFNNNEKIEQLIYKKHYTSQTITKENNQYKQQINSNLKCNTLTIDHIKKLKYNTTSLMEYFIKYNACNDLNYTNPIQGEKNTGKFNLFIKPSINFTSLSTENKNSALGKIDFGNNLNFGIGLESEFVLPFNNGRFALLFEPTFQSFKSEIDDYVYVNTTLGPKTTKVSINYKGIDLLFGIRFYFPISRSSKIFVNALYNFNTIDLGSNFDYETTSLLDLGLRGKNYFAFDIGYKFNNKISLEARFSSNQTIITNSLFDTNYPRTSIIFGYNLF
ncbi:hypothetical protein Q4Q39_18685 [Flavivirga amylovorans]|uniref:tRNA modification GTPase n=1 Tax=Flavivirga amylovorans TaxID=870486 RepID=A0ABT8X6C1_9FLAO|nr:hypothetical protein [Flavivirga amylovorans]MDO5989436.1 hypothetical protein [Flavivirga amylovorans]